MRSAVLTIVAAAVALLALLGGAESRVSTPTTTVLSPMEEECYYLNVGPREANENIIFYFSVLSGGNFDIHFSVKDPRGNVITEGDKQKHGDYLLKSRGMGEYSFCFDNSVSSVTSKVVEFGIYLESAEESLMNDPAMDEKFATARLSISKINDKIDNVINTLRYFKARDYRNLSTVRSTESRVFYSSFIAILMMIGISYLQVTLVRILFEGSRKTAV